MVQTKNKKAFTLVEILIGISIVSIVMVGAFQAFTSLGIGQFRLIQKTNTQKQALYFSEKVFEMIKYGGTIDYEEYFNRKLVNGTATSYLSGHYQQLTGFGNFGVNGSVESTTYGSGYYLCRSNDTTSMGTGGCIDTHNTTGLSTTNGLPQRYGQYSFHFQDYNSNINDDSPYALGDEDGDGSIIGDDDDDYFGLGPIVFTGGTNVHELYLINGVKRERTMFRYNVKLDPYAPIGSVCTTANSGETYTGTGCLGTIEYLKLEGRDWGLDHNIGTTDTNNTQYDGVIDTWLIDNDFGSGTIIAGSNANNYWQPLFPENIHVTEFKVYPHPNIDTNEAWLEDDDSMNTAEYVRLQLGMMPAWKDRQKIRGNPREYKFATTINLTDIFSR
ncbi:MAG: prepilin-type N-terminal cleavage/methylation domain-containing protein [Candidatus Gracilibacteria bacterium]|nr:prepilin-type N-terminal cleavage/methylation domain-containing protein [Candidatus Gracilibacteria bacterium]